jgi:TonB family protein
MARLVDIFDGENPKAIPCIAAVSVILHIFLFVGLPYILSLHWKPRILSRPPTFELVKIQMPTPAEPARPAVQPQEPPRQQEPRPQPVEPAPTPQPRVEPRPVAEREPQPTPQERPRPQPQERPRPQERPAEDDISDFLSAFDDPTTSQTTSAQQNVSISVSEPFPYQWYLDQIQTRIRREWTRGASNETGEVVVQFTIRRNGSIEGLRVLTGSGRGSLDRRATQSVGMAAPFPSLPPGYSGESLTVVLTLRLQR